MNQERDTLESSAMKSDSVESNAMENGNVESSAMEGNSVISTEGRNLKSDRLRQLVGLRYKRTAGDRQGNDCFGLVRSFWKEQGMKPCVADCFIFPSPEGKVYRRQVDLLLRSFIPVYSIAIFKIANYGQGDILLFALKSPSAIDHLGICLTLCPYTHNFLHMTRQSGSVISDLSDNWQKRLKGVIKCRQE